jgi:hypothetical protein
MKKPMRGYFERCLPSIQVKKKIVKCHNFLREFTRIHVNSREKV